MALFLQHKTDDIQWAVWKMEESLDALLALLPDARRVFCEQDLNRLSPNAVRWNGCPFVFCCMPCCRRIRKSVILPKENRI